MCVLVFEGLRGCRQAKTSSVVRILPRKERAGCRHNGLRRHPALFHRCVGETSDDDHCSLVRSTSGSFAHFGLATVLNVLDLSKGFVDRAFVSQQAVTDLN